MISFWLVTVGGVIALLLLYLNDRDGRDDDDYF